MKILVTGGHLTPALAVIQKIPKNVEVIYVGRKFALEGDTGVSLEYQTIASLNIPFIIFHPGRLQRKFTKYTVPALARIPKSIVQAIRILRREKPTVVLSFGGHVAFPICLAAAMLHIPFVIHEQTLEAGGTNRILARLATKICVSWESSLQFFPKEKTVLTGNPLLPSQPSQEIQEIVQKKMTAYPILTITGGSLGSHAINVLIEPIIKKLLAKYFIIHQTGDAQQFKDFDTIENIKSSLPYTFQERYIVRKFISPDDIAFVYNSSDLVVSRSGINTVLALLLGNIPSLLIPLPHSQRQEQYKNADFLQKSGLGQVLLQDDLTSERLLNTIGVMMKNRTMYANNNLSDMQRLHKHAAEKILQVVYDTQA